MISRKKLNPNWNTHSDFILVEYAKNEASKQTKCQFQIKTFLSNYSAVHRMYLLLCEFTI